MGGAETEGDWLINHAGRDGQMGTVEDTVEQDLGELTEKATGSLNRASEDLVAWCDVVRDQPIRAGLPACVRGATG